MFGQIFIVIVGIFLTVSGFSASSYVDVILGIGISIAALLRLYYLKTGKVSLLNSPDNSNVSNT